MVNALPCKHLAAEYCISICIVTAGDVNVGCQEEEEENGKQTSKRDDDQDSQRKNSSENHVKEVDVDPLDAFVNNLGDGGTRAELQRKSVRMAGMEN